MTSEKENVALSSVVAAIFLTLIKIVVGVITGSLGVLSEAAHSALDLGAAVITYFAVKISDKPADKDHHYGHGKIESFSALIETVLLLVTCGWIIFEAIERLSGSKKVEILGTAWGIGIMLLSIIIDISRSRALKKVAQKYGSQALEADALHFSSDVLSSTVVIVGLACVWLGKILDIPVLVHGDPVAALGVSVLVIVVSIQLGKRTIDVLLDAAPKGMVNTVMQELKQVKGVLDVSKVRVRPSGSEVFIDLSVGIGRNETHRDVYSITDEIKDRIRTKIPRSDVTVSTFPVDAAADAEENKLYQKVKKIVDSFPACNNIHNMQVYEVSGNKRISLHIEIRERMTIKESHELSHSIASMIQEAVVDVEDVSVNFQFVSQTSITAEDVTAASRELILAIEDMMNRSPHRLNCHNIKVFSQGGRKAIFLHCALKGDLPTEKIEKISEKISNKIKSTFKDVEGIHIHVEPIEKVIQGNKAGFF